MNDSSNDEKTIKTEHDGKPVNDGKPGKPYGEDISRAAVGRLFDEDAEDKSSQFVRGYGRNTSRRPGANEADRASQDTKPLQQETRTRTRRATTMLMDGADESELPAESSFTRPRERVRDRDRRRNPEPMPAVRTNVETVHKPEFRHPRDGKDAPQPENNLEGFRERYNPDELISAPRRRSGPPPRDGGARKPRGPAAPVPLAYGTETEGLNPLRIVGVVVAAGVLIFMVFLVIRMNGLSNDISDYRDQIADLEYAAGATSPSQLELDAMREERDHYRSEAQRLDNQLRQIGQHPDHQPQQPGPGQGVSDGTDVDVPTPTPEVNVNQQGFPRTVTVRSGDSLSRVVARYYGPSPPHTLVLHVAAANNLVYPYIVHEGQTLTLPPRP
ncbi:MAG: LysM peptidoglycan-binding domain-containing protein [Defluviitaleaceae bacterium]|nr:LysM peptidoglycan-binding domain-containing protein [Defluviitaleaceae bacterium]